MVDVKQWALTGLAAAGMMVGVQAVAQQKWDMPTGYPASNFHTENIQQFAKDVDQASGGKLKITVHDGGSLFKANEIKRAVQGGQAQAGGGDGDDLVQRHIDDPAAQALQGGWGDDGHGRL